MTEVFCKQTIKKIQELGASRKVASFYARFFYISMVSVSGIMITCMRHRKGAGILKDEIPRSIRHTLKVLIASTSRTTGSRIIKGPAAVEIVPASSRIHSH